MTCTMAITTLAMVATVFVLNLYGMKEKPVPTWAKKVFVVYLARILCMCNCMAPQEHKYVDAESKFKNSYTRVNTFDVKKHHAKNHESTFQGEPSQSPSPYHHIHRQEGGERGGGGKHAVVDYNKDWVHVAAVCDRFFFWLCLLFITVTTLLLFHPLTTSRYFKIPIIEDKGEAGAL